MRRDLASKVVRVANVVAREVERELKLDAPIETGNLRNLIITAVSQYANGTRIDIRSSASYDIYVAEFRDDWNRMLRRLPQMIESTWRRVQ